VTISFIIRMRKVAFVLVLVLAISPAVLAQQTAGFTPIVSLNERAVSLQASLYPDYYSTNSVRSDMSWVRNHDSALVAFWQQSGDTLLSTLASLSGIQWRDPAFDVYLVRYYTDEGSPEPLILPIGGIRTGSLIEAMPQGAQLEFDLIYQLAGRMLAQTLRPDAGASAAVANHPLMQPTPYRRDLLTLLLAYQTSMQVLGTDSTYAAYQSQFWKERTPARAIFEEYVSRTWTLTPEHPLVEWLANEPTDSKLIAATASPDLGGIGPRRPRRQFIEGLPLKGELGFSVRLNNANRLVVDGIDPSRLAYACGLREGDIIRQVNNSSVRTQKDLIEAILNALDTDGAMLTVTRAGNTANVFIRPPETASAEGPVALPADTTK
jgi:hypothetical protein